MPKAKPKKPFTKRPVPFPAPPPQVAQPSALDFLQAMQQILAQNQAILRQNPMARQDAHERFLEPPNSAKTDTPSYVDPGGGQTIKYDDVGATPRTGLEQLSSDIVRHGFVLEDYSLTKKNILPRIANVEGRVAELERKLGMKTL